MRYMRSPEAPNHLVASSPRINGNKTWDASRAPKMTAS